MYMATTVRTLIVVLAMAGGATTAIAAQKDVVAGENTTYNAGDASPDRMSVTASNPQDKVTLVTTAASYAAGNAANSQGTIDPPGSNTAVFEGRQQNTAALYTLTGIRTGVGPGGRELSWPHAWKSLFNSEGQSSLAVSVSPTSIPKGGCSVVTVSLTGTSVATASVNVTASPAEKASVPGSPLGLTTAEPTAYLQATGSATGTVTIIAAADGLESKSCTLTVTELPAVPAGINAASCPEPVVVPPYGSVWGCFHQAREQWKVDIAVYLDPADRKWKCKVSQAESGSTIFSRLLSGISEASVDAATQLKICKMEKDLNAHARNLADREYFAVAVVEAHERAHYDQWQEALRSKFPTMKTAIEALTIPDPCGWTPETAKAKFLELEAYNVAVAAAFTTAMDSQYALGDPNDATEAAENAAIKKRVDELEKKRADSQWPACPHNPKCFVHSTN